MRLAIAKRKKKGKNILVHSHVNSCHNTKCSVKIGHEAWILGYVLDQTKKVISLRKTGNMYLRAGIF